MTKSSFFSELLEVKGVTTIVRSATSQDLVHLEVLYTLISMANQSSASWTGEGHLIKADCIDRTSLRDIIAKDPSTLLLAFPVPCSPASPPSGNAETERPVACINTTIKEQVGLVSLLCVDPVWQSIGVVSALFLTSERYFLSKGALYSTLWALHRQEDVKTWYKRLGFQRTGRIENYPNTEDTFEDECYLIEMEKSLRKMVQ
ncbi:hypothetical protein BJ684DRAFT_19805 [Piptocephalis cylindrospora]|uniref:N-acetyltransferase domain-containing protein n=1 Tax=Piptocephalis cylindrospora TaxID=1907219 RepID=A0A4P9Y4M8_9FUNG|nr:hypothetical protein BJ684DRAFT_19805 [Piptocephalis cylindrospora]|eukprot:RKP13734.1 hypothetical protein BJ684DRAFT_19805 [Piptocephalis cylindrospora]